MMLVELTTVAQAALPVAELKEHLRLGSGFADDGVQDGLLEGFLRAALAAIEGRTGKALFEREMRWSGPVRLVNGAIALPVAPVSAVGEVALIDARGDETVLAGSDWRLGGDAGAPLLVLPGGAAGGRVRVDFLAGHGPDFADLPADLRQAVMMLAAHFYEYRHDTALSAGCMPFGVSSLIERYRPLRIGFGGRS